MRQVARASRSLLGVERDGRRRRRVLGALSYRRRETTSELGPIKRADGIRPGIEAVIQFLTLLRLPLCTERLAKLPTPRRPLGSSFVKSLAGVDEWSTPKSSI